ncbi:hypothetical protein [Halobacterium salinarum]|uniref:hypothetical protein n=1 Tax=Halobacterium salinarum TaxID=2242 RepID=UPI001F27186A|nr:hypothetical protein [Halobacterium salinarum]MCF2237625.1 hypothetical protein [Halobacterium salinarum]WJK64814.1 hypothetical protein QSJ49_12935 [Halobacterium salinarum]
MVSALSREQRFDLSIAAGAFIALCWILYVDPLTGELLGLVLGSLPVLAGVHLYIEPDQYVHQTLAGLAAVALGGAAPATILYQTPVGNWVVGSQPLPLSLGIMLVVTVGTLVGRRSVQSAIGSHDPILS